MTRVPIGTIVRLGVDEVAKAGKNLLRIERYKARVRSNKTTDKRLGRQFGVLIALERVESLNPDFRRRGDLLNGDPALFALLPEVFAKGETARIGSAQGKDLK